MIRLPHDRRTRIQFALIAAFLLTFYFGVRYVANWIEGGHDFLELQDAIARGNVSEIERQLKASASANVRNPGGGETPLFVAIQYDNLEVAELLFEHGADPNMKTEHGWTALHVAASHGPTMTRLLLDNGAVSEVSGYEKLTPLHGAAYRGHMESVRLLAEHGASLHARSEISGSPQDGSPAVVALRSGHVDITKYILFEAGGGDLSEENLDELMDAAASSGDIEMVQTFFEAGANPDAHDVRLVWHNNKRVYAGPITSAVLGGSAETVVMLIELGATVQDPQRYQGVPLLASAARRNSAEIINVLLKHGLDVDYSDDLGRTALHMASRGHASKAVEALIIGGADVNARTNYGETPVYFAVELASIDVLQLLLEHGADPSIPNANGDTPLSLARQIAIHADRPVNPPVNPVNAKAVLELMERHLSQSDRSSIVTPKKL